MLFLIFQDEIGISEVCRPFNRLLNDSVFRYRQLNKIIIKIDSKMKKLRVFKFHY